MIKKIFKTYIVRKKFHRPDFFHSVAVPLYPPYALKNKKVKNNQLNYYPLKVTK